MKLKKYFSKTLIFLVFASIVFLSTTFGQAANEEENINALSSTQKQLQVEAIKSDNESFNFSIKVPDLHFSIFETEQYGSFSKIKRQSSSVALRDGGIDNFSEPQSPVYTCSIALPIGETSDALISVEGSGEIEQKGIRLFPIQKPHRDSAVYEDKESFEFDKEIYLASAIKSGVASFEPIDRGKEYEEKDVNIYKLTINLVDYDPMDEVLTTYSSFDVKVTFTGDTRFFKRVWKNTNAKLPVMDAVDEYYEDSPTVVEAAVLNRNVLSNPEYTVVSESFQLYKGARFIIVTHENFERAAEDLRVHKIARGISTAVKVVDDTYTKDMIKDYLEFNYYRWAVRPKWVLLMGDAEFIPTHYAGLNTWDNVENAGDIFYGQFSDDDTAIPVFGIGRLPVDTLAQARTTVSKIIDYETNPPAWGIINDNPYYYTLTFAAMFQDTDRFHPVPDGQAVRWFAETSEDIRNDLLLQDMDVNRIYYTPNFVDPQFWEDGTPIPAELQKPAFAWDGDVTDIINAVNDGTSILYHRDHGWWHGWGDPSFHTADLSSISVSGNEFPVVYSINCASGIFDNETDAVTYDYDTSSTDVYFAEEFIRKSDGALAVIGDTRSSSTVLNNELAKGLFDATWPSGSALSIRKLGDVLNHAKACVKSGPYDISSIQQELLIYNLLGDPTVEVLSRERMKIYVHHEIEWLERIIEIRMEVHKDPEFIAGPITAVALVKDKREGVRAVGRARLKGDGIDKEAIISIPLAKEISGDSVTIVLSGPDMRTVTLNATKR